jgi:antitoxin (DNA-binding transcriptional repressor) of toxin-antitoxin stability system
MERAAAGDGVTVTRHGRPYVTISAARPERRRESRAALSAVPEPAGSGRRAMTG